MVSFAQPLCGVAKFHLSNGSTLHRVTPFADMSARGVKRSWGVMVNYVYEGEEVEGAREFAGIKVGRDFWGRLGESLEGRNTEEEET